MKTIICWLFHANYYYIESSHMTGFVECDRCYKCRKCGLGW